MKHKTHMKKITQEQVFQTDKTRGSVNSSARTMNQTFTHTHREIIHRLCNRTFTTIDLTREKDEHSN